MDVLGRVGPDLAVAVATRTEAIVDALGSLDDEALLSPCELPGWSRQTIACHLRYGAGALAQMTDSALAGLPASYYPDGRARQRLSTLRPLPGERPAEVVSSLAHRSNDLRAAWAALTSDAWDLEVTEPERNRDFGSLSMARLALLRLTEVEVHGTDLGLGLNNWSEFFVSVALPFRLGWLATRRSNHLAFDEQLQGSWLLVATDGPIYLVTTVGSTVEAHPATAATPATAVIEATSHDLLALLLGRTCQRLPRFFGDTVFAHAFKRAFPGP